MRLQLPKINRKYVFNNKIYHIKNILPNLIYEIYNKDFKQKPETIPRTTVVLTSSSIIFNLFKKE